MEIFPCHRMLASPVLLLLLCGACAAIPLDADEQSLMGYWNELVMRCRRPDEAEEGSVPVRPVRRLGSEFLGKRTVSMEQVCTQLVFSEEIDEDWLCHCIRHWSQPTSQPTTEEEEETVVNKRGLGAILLSGKRMTNNKFNNGLNRRVMGSEFLGKRALIGSEFLGKRALGSEFLGKRALGSEFLGKRAIMGSEFLGKRSGSREDGVIPKI